MYIHIRAHIFWDILWVPISTPSNQPKRQRNDVVQWAWQYQILCISNCIVMANNLHVHVANTAINQKYISTYFVRHSSHHAFFTSYCWSWRMKIIWRLTNDWYTCHTRNNMCWFTIHSYILYNYGSSWPTFRFQTRVAFSIFPEYYPCKLSKKKLFFSNKSYDSWHRLYEIVLLQQYNKMYWY